MIGSQAQWLKASPITKTVWRIEDAGTVSEYLVAGKEQALLIDCGWGVGDLAKAVAGLTKLPLIVVNTHGHRDHTSGDYLFKDTIRIHDGDVPLLKASYDPTNRRNTLQRFPEETWPPGFDAEAWIHAPMPKYEAFRGPMSFDLGGRVIDIIGTPGHTPGSFCVYDRNEQLLFPGDTINAGNVLMMMPESLTLATYLKSIDRLVAIADKIDEIYPSHGPVPMKPEALKAMQAGVRKIMAGKINGEPETTFLGSGLATRFDGCGILYREDNLR